MVRLATARDGDALRALVTPELSAFDVEAELVRPYARIWLAHEESDEASPLGFLLAWLVVDEVHLIDLLVGAQHRRRGLGRALVRALVEHSRAQRMHRVLLEVRRSNHAAQRLYAAFGFTEVGERTAYYSDGEDALLLELLLQPSPPAGAR